MLNMTSEQLETYNRYLNGREYAKVREGDDYLYYNLTEEQKGIIRGLLCPLIREWSPLYTTYYANATMGIPDPSGATYFYENDISEDEKLAIYLGFHSYDEELHEYAQTLVVYAMLGIVKNRAKSAVELLRKPYESSLEGKDIAYSDAMGDMVSILSNAAVTSYQSYDYLRSKATFTTYCRTGIGYAVQDGMNSISGDGYDKHLNERLKIFRAAVESLPPNASDVEIQKRFNELSDEMNRKKGTDKVSKITDRELQKLKNSVNGVLGLGHTSLDQSYTDDDNEDSSFYNAVESSRMNQSEDYANPEDVYLKKEAEVEDEKNMVNRFEPLELEMYRTIQDVLGMRHFFETENASKNQSLKNEWKKNVEKDSVRIFVEEHPTVSKDHAKTLYNTVTFARFQQLFIKNGRIPTSRSAVLSICDIVFEVEEEEFCESASALNIMFDAEDLYDDDDDEGVDFNRIEVEDGKSK